MSESPDPPACPPAWVRKLSGYHDLKEGTLSMISFLCFNNARCRFSTRMQLEGEYATYEDAKKAAHTVHEDAMPANPEDIPMHHNKSMSKLVCNPNSTDTLTHVVCMPGETMYKVWYTDTGFHDERVVFTLINASDRPMFTLAYASEC